MDSLLIDWIFEMIPLSFDHSHTKQANVIFQIKPLLLNLSV